MSHNCKPSPPPFFTRRGLIKTVLLAGGVQLVQACGGGGDDSTTAPAPAPAPPLESVSPSAPAPTPGGGAVTPTFDADVVIYGVTPSGLMAAVAAASAGARVILVEPTMYVGGMPISGIAKTDYRGHSYRFMNPLTREFYQRAAAARGVDSFAAALDHWNFTGADFMAVIEDHVSRHKLSVVLGARIRLADGVQREGTRVIGATFENSQGVETARVTAQQFIDASYTADLAHAAGATFVVGREAMSEYGEANAGVRRPSQLFNDPYLQEGVPSSGLLPGVVNQPPPAFGSADRSVQWSCHRLMMTKDPANRLAFQAPRNYDATRYEVLRRWTLAGRFTDLSQLFTRYTINSTLGHGMVEAWNSAFPTLNMLGGQHSYPTADYEERQRLDEELVNYTLGLFQWLRTDISVPQSFKDELSQWGPLKTEVYDANGLPPLIYRRETRRLIGAPYIVTEHDVMGRTRSANGIAYGYYNIDVHNCAAWFDGSKIQLEGNFSGTPPNIYPLDRGCALPARAQLENLQVSVCIAATHVAWGSIRIEPTLQSIGEACGLAAAVAVASRVSVHDVPIEQLRKALDLHEVTKDFLVLATDGDANFGGATVASLIQTYGSIKLTGAWDFDRSPIGWHQAGRGVYHDRGTGKGAKFIRFYPKFEESGLYNIRAWIPSRDSVDIPDASVLSVTVVADGVRSAIQIHPKRDDIVGSVIGSWRFRAGSTDYIEISNAGTAGSRVRLSAISWELTGT